MPDLSAYLDFSVLLDKTNNVITLTDTSSYPGGVAATVTGVFSVTQPDGVSVVGNFTSPDTSWNGSQLTTNNKELRYADDSTFQNGIYTITYTVKATGYTDTVKTKTFTLNYASPAVILTDLIDVFTPQFLETDSTNYSRYGFNAPTISRAWSAIISYADTINPMITGSGLPFDMAYTTYYYDANYNISLTTTLTYVSSTYSWVSLKDVVAGGTQVDAYAPPSLANLRSSLSTMKTQIDNGTYCGCGCGCKPDYTPYTEAVSLYDQIVARGQAGETIGLETYVVQLQRLFVCSGVVPVHTNQIISPYNFENAPQIIGNNTYSTIQFIVCTSGMLNGDTTYTIPVAVNHGSIQVFNNGLLVQPQVDISDADLNYTVTYNDNSAVLSFYQNGVPTAPDCGTRIIITYSQFSSGSTSSGLQSTVVVVPSTSNTLYVSQLGQFVAMMLNGVSYDTTYISQSGQTLDCTNIGGVTAGQKATIFYYP